MVFCPSDSSTDHRYLNNSPLYSAPATQAGSWLFLNTLSMLLPQGFCNCSIWNTLLPNTHIACSLTCQVFAHKPILKRTLLSTLQKTPKPLLHNSNPHSYYTALVGGLVIKSCLILVTLWSPPDSSVHGIFQARILEWAVISFSRGSFPSRNQISVSCIAGRFLTNWATREALLHCYVNRQMTITSSNAVF